MVTLHETPFFIYSNDFELEEDIGMRSLIYLNNYVNKRARKYELKYKKVLKPYKIKVKFIR